MAKQSKSQIVKEWKDIKGFEGLYQVSTLGEIKSVPRHIKTKAGWIKPVKERLLKFSVNHKGYKHVGLSKESVVKTFSLHRLVAEAFIPNPENKPQVDHINGIKIDNRVENLRWVTNNENMMNPITLEKRGRKSKKIIQRCLVTNRVVNMFLNSQQVENILGFEKSSIRSCARGVQNTAFGFRWEYV